MKAPEAIENIVNNWQNGNLTDTVNLIKEYGETFFEDLDFHLPSLTFYRSDHVRIFVGIAKLYFRHTFNS